MRYLNSLLQKYMPSRRPIGVNSSPKLHGIFDTINATLAASDPRIVLPKEFFDPKAYDIMDRIVMEEEYSGYKENLEYRRLGIGPILAEVVSRMNRKAGFMPSQRASDAPNSLPVLEASRQPALALYACHDSTLAATLTTLDAWGSRHASWPPYTSSLAIELFRQDCDRKDEQQAIQQQPSTQHYVRLRYNDSAVFLPACKQAKYHLPGHENFCTLVGGSQSCVLLDIDAICLIPHAVQDRFGEIVNSFTPRDWKAECVANIGKNPFGTV